MGRVTLQQLAARGVTLSPEEAALYDKIRNQKLQFSY